MSRYTITFDHERGEVFAYDADLNTYPVSKAQWAFGVNQMVMRPGMYALRVPTERPPTNPWRHAFTRAKHFTDAREALYRLHDRYLDQCGCPPYEPDDEERAAAAETPDEVAWIAHLDEEAHRWDAYCVAHGAIGRVELALERCNWGCR
jgi:hypothetical protein